MRVLDDRTDIQGVQLAFNRVPLYDGISFLQNPHAGVDPRVLWEIIPGSRRSIRRNTMDIIFQNGHLGNRNFDQLPSYISSPRLSPVLGPFHSPLT